MVEVKRIINKDELLYKIETIIEYFKNNNGYGYKLYNRSCPYVSKPDSNIVEYAEDIKEIINKIFEEKEDKNNDRF